LTAAGIAVGGVIGIAAICCGIWAARRWGTRRGKLLLAFSVTDLMPSEAPHEDLGFTYKGLPVRDPQLVKLRLKNVGPHDITRDKFDQDKPLFVGLDATFMGLLRTASTSGVAPQMAMGAIGTENAEIGFMPGHLPKGAEWTAELIVEGKSSPHIRGLLIDTDIEEGESSSLKVLREVAVLTAPWPFKPLVDWFLH